MNKLPYFTPLGWSVLFLSRCRCWGMDSSADVNHSRIVVTKKAAALTATSFNGKKNSSYWKDTFIIAHGRCFYND